MKPKICLKTKAPMYWTELDSLIGYVYLNLLSPDRENRFAADDENGDSNSEF